MNYYIVKDEEDPFLDNANSGLLYKNQQKHVGAEIKGILQKMANNGIPERELDKLHELAVHRMDVFRIEFSAGPSAKFKPLNIYLVPDTKPMRVRLRKCPQDQRLFLYQFLLQLVQAEMAYINHSAEQASAPLLVPPSRFLHNFFSLLICIQSTASLSSINCQYQTWSKS